MYHIFFIHSYVDGHLGCFRDLDVVDSATVSIGMHVCFELWFSWDICLGGGLLDHMLLLLHCFSRVRLCATHRRQPTRLPRPWDSPGKNTGVGCHFLLQCMKVKRESKVAQSCLTLRDPMDCSLPGSSVHGIFQARVLEWGAGFSFLQSLHIVLHSGSYLDSHQQCKP